MGKNRYSVIKQEIWSNELSASEEIKQKPHDHLSRNIVENTDRLGKTCSIRKAFYPKGALPMLGGSLRLLRASQESLQGVLWHIHHPGWSQPWGDDLPQMLPKSFPRPNLVSCFQEQCHECLLYFLNSLSKRDSCYIQFGIFSFRIYSMHMPS